MVRGMESVIATVSGYHGTERFRLIKLISLTGASYVGTLAKSTTHLVCWELSGNKYNLAKSFGTKIVSHQWFEDCLKHGKRLPEEPYLMKCGKQVGILSWKPPEMDNQGDKKQASHRKRSALADRSNLVDDFDRTESSNIDNIVWISSSLLEEHKTGHYPSGRASSSKTRRKTCRVGASINDDSISKAQRPATRKNRHRNPTGSYDLPEIICDSKESVDLNWSAGERSVPFSAFRDSDVQFLDSTSLDNQGSRMAESENILESNTVPVDPCDIPDTGDTNSESLLEDTYTDSLSKQCMETEEMDLVSKGVTPALSCVICFTEFSSSRGVLPCGHRFCYSCIQGWADYVTANKKVPTCPLCKACFTSITKVEGAASSDQKIYSQTIPSSSTNVDIYVVPNRGNLERIVDMVCTECRSHEPEDLLTNCHICNNQWVHTCCLDPLLIPWTCIHCRDLRMLYQLFR